MLLHKELESKGVRLILASKSPRRRQLLMAEIFGGTAVECVTKDYEVREEYPAQTPARDVAEYLSRLKSDGYPEVLTPREILVTADTVVLSAEGEILGKPKDGDDARRMLEALSGAKHLVLTGVTLRSAERSVSFTASTEVQFAELSDDEIDYYIERFAPMDKAGSYGIQEWVGVIGVASISGSYYNVMGLPTCRLYRELGAFVEGM